MPFRVTNHNCHDLVRWQVRDQTRFEFFEDLNRPFSFFRVQGDLEPDIVLTVGPFKPDEGLGQFQINHKYRVGLNYVYCRENLAKGWYEVEIRGLDDSRVAVRFNGRPGLLARAVAPLVLVHQWVLRQVISYHLFRQNAHLLHGAGICRVGHAIVLAGRGGAFKTSIAMDLVRQEGYKCLGDDAVIVSNARAYPFPTHPQLFAYRALHLQDEKLGGLLGRIGALKFLLRSDPAGSNSWEGLFARTSQPLGALVVVGRTHSEAAPTIQRIGRETAVERLVANDYLEIAAEASYMGQAPTPLVRYLDAYAMVYPNSYAATLRQNTARVIRRSLGNTACYELVLPASYDENVAKRVIEMISDL